RVSTRTRVPAKTRSPLWTSRSRETTCARSGCSDLGLPIGGTPLGCNLIVALAAASARLKRRARPGKNSGRHGRVAAWHAHRVLNALHGTRPGVSSPPRRVFHPTDLWRLARPRGVASSLVHR